MGWLLTLHQVQQEKRFEQDLELCFGMNISLTDERDSELEYNYPTFFIHDFEMIECLSLWASNAVN